MLEENWGCREDQKVSALTWTREQRELRTMNPLRYISRLLLKERPVSKGDFTTPKKLVQFLTSYGLRPSFEASSQAGLARHWVSEDGITVFSYYPKAISISTRFADDTGIVSIDKKMSKKNTVYLKLHSDLSESWRAHREEVEKRVQDVAAIDQGSLENHLAYEDYWNSFTSTLLIPILLVSPFIITVVLLTLNAYIPETLDLLRSYLKTR